MSDIPTYFGQYLPKRLQRETVVQNMSHRHPTTSIWPSTSMWPGNAMKRHWAADALSKPQTKTRTSCTMDPQSIDIICDTTTHPSFVIPQPIRKSCPSRATTCNAASCGHAAQRLCMSEGRQERLQRRHSRGGRPDDDWQVRAVAAAGCCDVNQLGSGLLQPYSDATTKVITPSAEQLLSSAQYKYCHACAAADHTWQLLSHMEKVVL